MTTRCPFNVAFTVTFVALLAPACGGHRPRTPNGAPASPPSTAVADLRGTDTASHIDGEVRLDDQPGGQVELTVRIEGLEPGSRHGFHIHAVGDCTAPDASSAGGHFAPRDHEHGLPPTKRHAGDLGNVVADARGEVTETIVVDGISLDPNSREGVLGRAFILHAEPDDGGGTSGHAGPRLACGVIGRDAS